ncbi:hypothetical protein DAEQUDRAFT_231202 [Daedalea quercina L-15889]|uniref:Uncharacterized protein n=1 Tax=Daedalea quercina L-15889 TaxID=1314783 RepID=A0A165QTP5_9APHY|nr:hypothetical protein DAEQUDRAFT_231202 [Daedalea quercina L-15889]
MQGYWSMISWTVATALTLSGKMHTRRKKPQKNENLRWRPTCTCARLLRPQPACRCLRCLPLSRSKPSVAGPGMASSVYKSPAFSALSSGSSRPRHPSHSFAVESPLTLFHPSPCSSPRLSFPSPSLCLRWQ